MDRKDEIGWDMLLLLDKGGISLYIESVKLYVTAHVARGAPLRAMEDDKTYPGRHKYSHISLPLCLTQYVLGVSFEL